MKNFMKIAAVAALLVVSGNINAQDEFGGKKGNFGTEIQFNPFSNNFTTFKLDNVGLKFRYFISDEHAIRLGLNVGFDNKVDGINNPVVPNVLDPKYTGAEDINYIKDVDEYNNTKDDKQKLNTTKFAVNLGYEYHFAKYGRADLYAGAKVGFSMVNNKTTVDNTTAWGYDAATGLSKWTNLTQEYKGYDNISGNSNSFAISAGVFTGVDFYITKHLFVGAELGINFKNTKYKDYDVNEVKKAKTFNTDGATVSLTNKHLVTDKDTELNFYVEPALRLGWTF